MAEQEREIQNAAELIRKSKYTTAFTGAGISVESGIPPFRGGKGLWNKYDPQVLEINYFFSNPLESWTVIKEIFYDFFGDAQANPAHTVLAELEKNNKLHAVITQNIDDLHNQAGNKNVIEFHGNSKEFICTDCEAVYKAEPSFLNHLPPLCPTCNGLLKPDFVFFGEQIPPLAYQKAMDAANKSEVFIVIGCSLEVYPAAMIPNIAKQNGAKIIEVNLHPSENKPAADITLTGQASELMQNILSLST